MGETELVEFAKRGDGVTRRADLFLAHLTSQPELEALKEARHSSNI